MHLHGIHVSSVTKYNIDNNLKKIAAVLDIGRFRSVNDTPVDHVV